MKGFTSLAILLAILWSNRSSAESLHPSSPPNVCTAKFGAWCTLQYAKSTRVERHGVDIIEVKPTSPRGTETSLVVAAPLACRKGFADQMTFAGLTLDTPFDGARKDELKVVLNSTCTLSILLPRWNDDPMEWPYHLGLDAIRPCPDERCKGPSVGDLRNKFEIKYRRALIRP